MVSLSWLAAISNRPQASLPAEELFMPHGLPLISRLLRTCACELYRSAPPPLWPGELRRPLPAAPGLCIPALPVKVASEASAPKMKFHGSLLCALLTFIRLMQVRCDGTSALEGCVWLGLPNIAAEGRTLLPVARSCVCPHLVTFNFAVETKRRASPKPPGRL